MSLGREQVFPVARALFTLNRVACAEGDFAAARGYMLELLRHAQQCAIDSFALTALVAMAELLATQAQLERAAEMAALVQVHPHTYAIDRDAVARLLNALKVDQAVSECAKALDVQGVVSAVMADWPIHSKFCLYVSQAIGRFWKNEKVRKHLSERWYSLITMLRFAAPAGQRPDDNDHQVEPRVCAQRDNEPRLFRFEYSRK